MRRFRVYFWLLAWSLWAAAGVQLYRELPRVFTVRCSLTPGERNWILGVSTDERKVLSAQSAYGPVQEGIRRMFIAGIDFWDVRDGSKIRSWDFERHGACWSDRLHFIVLGRPARGDGPPVVLDLRTDVERPIACEAPVSDFLIVSFHDSRPWGVFKGRTARDKGARPELARFVVADLNDGSIVATIPPVDEQLPSDRIYYDYAAFVPGTDLLLVKAISDDWVSEEFQVWNVPKGRRPERNWRGPYFASFPSIAKNGRAVVQVPGAHELAGAEGSAMKFADVVLDLRIGTVLLRKAASVDERDDKKPRALSFDSPLLSADGRTLIQPRSRSAWDVDTGAWLWGWEDRTVCIGCDHDSVIQLQDGNGMRPLHAWWNRNVGQFVPSLKISDSSFSVNDLRTGAQLYRSPEPTISWEHRLPGTVAASRTSVKRDGVVRDLPPRPPWQLLATMQAMLASPIVALWLWGVWRRRRARVKAIDA